MKRLIQIFVALAICAGCFADEHLKFKDVELNGTPIPTF